MNWIKIFQPKRVATKMSEKKRNPSEIRFYPDNPSNPIFLLKRMKREYERYPILGEDVKAINSAIFYLMKNGWTE